MQKIFNLQSYRLFLGVFPPGTQHALSPVYVFFHIHTSYQSGILGLGGGQGQQGENVQFSENFHQLK